MVSAQSKPGLPPVAIDVLGAAALVACLLGCGYVAIIRGGELAAEMTELSTAIQGSSEDLATARAACDRQRAILDQRRGEASSERQLPAKLPLESYFQRLAAHADQNQVRVLRQNPLPERRYPGLLEQRFAFEVSSSVPNLAGFLKAVESDESWADVAYLKITGADAQSAAADGHHVTTMTLSLFSAEKPEPAPTPAGAKATP